MPGWLIHIDAARRALDQLPAIASAAPAFTPSGPAAASLRSIARAHPAYTAFGAIGPDLFFLLPDFKPPMGSMLYGAAETVCGIYDWWEENFLEPYENQLGPIAANTADQLGALTGGLSSQLASIMDRASSFLLDTVKVLALRQYDVFGLLTSGVPAGYDEQAFFWSDTLHYRKTYEFTRYMWEKATAEANGPMQAYALGWMCHLAGDVSGHGFVNQKCGGPFRLHWQRHHLVENHMDARIYDSRFGALPIYTMLSNSAMHLWIAFNPDGTSRHDAFTTPVGPAYATGDATADVLDRKSKWDVDSDLPPDLARFLAEALREFYNDTTVDLGPQGQWASHPTIVESLQPGSGGYPDAAAVETAYWWLFRYARAVTIDFYKIRRPAPPTVFNLQPFPTPPGTGASDPGPGATSTPWATGFEILVAIFAWIQWIAQVAVWPATFLAGLITSAGTYPVRLLLYELVEVPLYNAWAALHWYLAMTGYVYPTLEEAHPGLHTLGVGVDNVWEAVLAALATPLGGLVPPPVQHEPSGADIDDAYPRDVVADPDSYMALHAPGTIFAKCQRNQIASEFLRPWRWPDLDNEGHPVPSETGVTRASSHPAGRDPLSIVTGHPGHNPARAAFEAAANPAATDAVATAHLPNDQHLGDATDYAAYVIARLTRDNPGPIANFNLDADRGYGYLCWDWRRSATVKAEPQAFRGEADRRTYAAPLYPGFGWCADDVVPPGTSGPVMHQPGVPGQPSVQIRYIDREPK